MWETDRDQDTPPTTKLSHTRSSFQAPQLSPLSGAYLLIVVGEPFSEEHKKLILNKLQQGKTEDHKEQLQQAMLVTTRG